MLFLWWCNYRVDFLFKIMLDVAGPIVVVHTTVVDNLVVVIPPALVTGVNFC